MRQGFVTVCGGHRVGVAGQVVLEHGRVRNVKHISFINIRVSHQIKGCATCLFAICDQGWQVVAHTDHIAAGMWKDDNLAGSGAADIGWEQLLQRDECRRGGRTLRACRLLHGNSAK